MKTLTLKQLWQIIQLEKKWLIVFILCVPEEDLMQSLQECQKTLPKKVRAQCNCPCCCYVHHYRQVQMLCSSTDPVTDNAAVRESSEQSHN